MTDNENENWINYCCLGIVAFVWSGHFVFMGCYELKCYAWWIDKHWYSGGHCLWAWGWVAVTRAHQKRGRGTRLWVFSVNAIMAYLQISYNFVRAQQRVTDWCSVGRWLGNGPAHINFSHQWNCKLNQHIEEPDHFLEDKTFSTWVILLCKWAANAMRSMLIKL